MSDCKETSSSSSISTVHNRKIWPLSDHVKAILKEGINEGFNNDTLNLKLKGIDDSMIPELCGWLLQLEGKVKNLDMSCNQITSDGASTLFDTLGTANSTIKLLNLISNEYIDDKCMKSLGEYIKSNKYIEMVSLDRTSISDAGVEILAPYLDGNITIKQLRLDWNKGITDRSIPLLMKIIESSCIERLNIDCTLITTKNIIFALLDCNRIKNGLTSLNLSYTGLNDDGLIKICEGMKKYGIDNLKEIFFQHNKITSKGASVLFDTLKECNSVVSILDLSVNQLDDECMKQLGEYIQDNEYVEILRIINAGIADKGVEILSEYLIGNTTLKELYLYDNKGVTDRSAPYLIDMINKSCIRCLNVGETSMPEEKKQKIQEALSIGIEQREIPIKSNTKSAAKLSTYVST